MSRCLGAVAVLLLIPLASTALGQEDPVEEDAYSADAGSLDFCSDDDGNGDDSDEEEDDPSSCGARRRRHSRDISPPPRDMSSPPPDPDTLRQLHDQAFPQGPFDEEALNRQYDEEMARGIPDEITDTQLQELLESRGYGDPAMMDKYGLSLPYEFLTISERNSLDANAEESLQYLNDVAVSVHGNVDLTTPPSPGPLPGGFPQPPIDIAPPDASPPPIEGPRPLGGI